MPYKDMDIGVLGVISASESPDLFHCGHGTMLRVYNRLIGKVEEREYSEETQKSFDFGIFFEEPVAQYFTHRTGLKVKKVGNGLRAYFTKEQPYFICHPDRLGVGKDTYGRRFALEIKCVRPSSDGWGEDGSSDIPDNYFFQVQSYFACGVPCDVVYLACMKGNRVNIYEILPDELVIEAIRKTVKEFKENADKGIEPKPENYEEASKVYGRKVRLEEEGIGANDTALELYKKIMEAHKAVEGAKTEEETYKQKLMELLGEYPAFLSTQNGKVKRICYWLDTTRSSFDLKAFKRDNPSVDVTPYESQKTTRSFRVNLPTKED